MNDMNLDKQEEMDAEDVMEAKDVKKLNVILSEDTTVKFMELMGITGNLRKDKAIEDIIKRTYNRETSDRGWKSRVKDRRKLLLRNKEDIEEKLKNIKKLPKWKKFLMKIKEKGLKKEKRKIEIRLKEQLRTYRLVSNIE